MKPKRLTHEEIRRNVMVDALIIISTGRTKINRRNLDTDQDKTLDEGDAMDRRPG